MPYVITFHEIFFMSKDPKAVAAEEAFKWDENGIWFWIYLIDPKAVLYMTRKRTKVNIICSR
jgi:hypothetical protein